MSLELATDHGSPGSEFVVTILKVGGAISGHRWVLDGSKVCLLNALNIGTNSI